MLLLAAAGEGVDCIAAALRAPRSSYRRRTAAPAAALPLAERRYPQHRLDIPSAESFKKRPAPPALGGARPEAQKTNCMALLARPMAARAPLGAYRPNRRSRYPLLDPLNGHKAVDLPNQRPVISTVLGHDRSHSKKPGSKRPSTDTQTMSITGLGGVSLSGCAAGGGEIRWVTVDLLEGWSRLASWGGHCSRGDGQWPRGVLAGIKG